MNNTLDRTIMGIMSLGYVIIAVFLVIMSLGWTSPVLLAENYLLYTTNRWIVGLTGVIVFVFSLTVFWSSFRTRPDKLSVIHETSLGQVKITLPALEHLVTKSARGVQGIRDVKPFLKNRAGGLSIQLRVQVLPDTGIPQLSEELQKNVREYLLKTAGITAHEIKVVVSKITTDSKSRVE